MSESPMYTEDDLNVDIKKQTQFFRDMFNRDIARIRYNIITDYRMPREGWEIPYQNIIHISNNLDRDSSALSACLHNAMESFRQLNTAAEAEMVEMQIQMSSVLDSMENVKKDPVKDYQRELRHATRSMDREEIKAGAQEKSLTSSIVKLAKEGRVDLCKTKAKELVRLRAHRHRIATMKGHMSTLQHQLSTVQSAKVMQETMAKTTHLLRSLNSRLDAKAIHRMLMEFERQSVTFTDGQEILESTLDGIFESEEEQTNTDQAVASVFSELGLELQFEMAPSNGLDPQILAPTDDNIEARLRKLQSL